MTELTLYAILSEEAVKASGGNRGKMAAQCGHAFVSCALVPYRQEGLSGEERKVVLIAPEAELLTLQHKYERHHGMFAVKLIRDAGHTVLEPGTLTALGIGPLYEDEIGDDLKALKVWI